MQGWNPFSQVSLQRDWAAFLGCLSPHKQSNIWRNMGTGIRIFFVDDDGAIKRFPLTRYLRLTERDPNERLPEYANTRVRCVEAAMELEQRKPVDILRLLYIILFFDAEGRLDATEKEKEWQLSAEIAPPFLEQESKQVVDARHRFAKRRFHHKYRWEPTQETEFAVMEAIFGSS